MLINNTFHYSYCTNIHGGENWEITFQNLQDFVPSIKNEVVPNEPFGLGLRLSNTASEELNVGTNLIDFKQWLAENNLYVFTMNGFPYGSFHNTIVKDKVHTPDWTTPERVSYTKRLFDQLAFLLPKNVSGGISTSPISYKHWHTAEQKQKVLEVGANHLVEVVLHLIEIETNTGKYLHLDIEPEPDGMLENTAEFLLFYNGYLLPVARNSIQDKLELSVTEIDALIRKHITICYDVCHFSLAFEEPKDTFKALKQNKILVGKIQVSAALKIIFDGENDADIWESLSKFNEATYLHQVTEKVGKEVKVYNDLPIVLENKSNHSELRAHFHVPIFLEQFDNLHSTQDHILKVMDYLKGDAISTHIEVETYTWEVLPNNLKMDLDKSIVRELKWLQEKF